MPFLANGDIVSLKLFCKCENQQAITRLKFRATNKVGISITDQEACDQLSSFFGTLMVDWMSANASYLGAQFQIERLTRRPYVTSTIGTAAGAVLANTLPAQASGLVKWKTALTGKTERGRAYLPFLSETYLSINNTVSAAGLVKLDAFAAAYVVTGTYNDGFGNSIQLQPIVDSRGSPTSVPPIPAHSSDVTGYQVSNKFATQRRRSQINKADTFGP